MGAAAAVDRTDTAGAWQARASQPFGGRLVVLGCGSIGQAVLPLLCRHLAMPPERMLVVAPTDTGAPVARAYEVPFLCECVTRENHVALLESWLRPGDFLLNLSIDVSSAALVSWCRAHGVLYLDTCIEPWAGGYTDDAQSPEARTNHALREAVLALRDGRRDGPTAVLAHGANPGLVSHLFKRALLDVAAACGAGTAPPGTRDEWAALAARLGVRTVHIAERDTQSCARRKRAGEFVNTWSVRAFVDEARQPAELGWGTHERTFPADGARHDRGTPAAIYLLHPGGSVRVRSWTPMGGAYHGFLITHAESISIADHFTLGDPAQPDYRPTVLYAYHPCDDAVLSLHELAGRNWRLQAGHRVIKEDIEDGIDELGVLLMGHARGAYWYGSPLSNARARTLCPHNSATSLQVACAVMAGVQWAMRNPDAGIVEPDDLPFEEVLALCEPYLGGLVGAFSPWTPLQGRDWPMQEHGLDRSDPWQFANFRVA